MSEARNHHYVPQGYLRNFASGKGKEAKVQVFDLVRQATFKTTVRNVAAKRDFNRIDADHHAPNALEAAYGVFEGDACEALRRVCERRAFHLDDDGILVLNLLTLLAVRNPIRRAVYGDFVDRVHRKIARLLVANEERWSSVTSRAKAAGYVKSEASTTFDQVKDFVERDQYDVVTSTTMHARLEIDMFDKLLQVMVSRTWRLIEAGTGAGEFITSDHPVTLVAADERLYGTPLGYGLRDTAVFFPLSRHALLVGEFDGAASAVPAGLVEVAAYNSELISHTHAQVFAFDDSFPYLCPEPMALRRGSDLIGETYFQRGKA